MYVGFKNVYQTIEIRFFCKNEIRGQLCPREYTSTPRGHRVYSSLSNTAIDSCAARASASRRTVCLAPFTLVTQWKRLYGIREKQYGERQIVRSLSDLDRLIDRRIASAKVSHTPDQYSPPTAYLNKVSCSLPPVTPHDLATP